MHSALGQDRIMGLSMCIWVPPQCPASPSGTTLFLSLLLLTVLLVFLFLPTFLFFSPFPSLLWLFHLYLPPHPTVAGQEGWMVETSTGRGYAACHSCLLLGALIDNIESHCKSAPRRLPCKSCLGTFSLPRSQSGLVPGILHSPWYSHSFRGSLRVYHSQPDKLLQPLKGKKLYSYAVILDLF